MERLSRIGSAIIRPRRGTIRGLLVLLLTGSWLSLVLHFLTTCGCHPGTWCSFVVSNILFLLAITSPLARGLTNWMIIAGRSWIKPYEHFIDRAVNQVSRLWHRWPTRQPPRAPPPAVPDARRIVVPVHRAAAPPPAAPAGRRHRRVLAQGRIPVIRILQEAIQGGVSMSELLVYEKVRFLRTKTGRKPTGRSQTCKLQLSNTSLTIISEAFDRPQRFDLDLFKRPVTPHEKSLTLEYLDGGKLELTMEGPASVASDRIHRLYDQIVVRLSKNSPPASNRVSLGSRLGFGTLLTTRSAAPPTSVPRGSVAEKRKQLREQAVLAPPKNKSFTPNTSHQNSNIQKKTKTVTKKETPSVSPKRQIRPPPGPLTIDTSEDDATDNASIIITDASRSQSRVVRLPPLPTSPLLPRQTSFNFTSPLLNGTQGLVQEMAEFRVFLGKNKPPPLRPGAIFLDDWSLTIIIRPFTETVRYNLNNFKQPPTCPTGKSLYLEFVAAGHLELVFEGGNAGRMKRFYDEFKTRHEKITAAPMSASPTSSQITLASAAGGGGAVPPAGSLPTKLQQEAVIMIKGEPYTLPAGTVFFAPTPAKKAKMEFM